jgi:hypothetical protein
MHFDTKTTKDPPMLKELDAEAYVVSAWRVLGLPERPEWRAEVTANLRQAAAAAELLLEFELEETVEAAPVFEA